MNIDEYKERSLEVGKGLHDLLNNLYDAIDEDAPLEKVHIVLDTATKKIGQYELLYSESSEVWKEGLKKKYADEIKLLHDFMKQLKEKYPNKE